MSPNNEPAAVGRTTSRCDAPQARVEADGVPVQESVRRISRILMLERGGATTDDSTLLMLEWTGGPAADLSSKEEQIG